jgi:drug/metabolite transporter (DMT)-like permease
MTWQILIAIDILAVAASSLLQKTLMKREHVNPVAFAAVFQLAVSIFIGITLLFTGFELPNLKPIWLNLLFMPFLYALGNVSKFQSLKKIDASEFTVIFQASTLITVAVAVVFLGEIFKFYEILGLVLVVAAVLLVTLKNRLSLRFSSGQLWALLCAVAYGLAFANDVYILRTFDVWTYSFLAFLVPGLFTLVYLGRGIEAVKPLVQKETVLKLSVTALIYGIGVVAVYGAYQIGRNAAQIASITPTYSILIVIFAAIFLKERSRLPVKLFAAVLATIGVVLLS